MKKYFRPVWVAVALSVTGATAALDEFSDLESISWWESIAVGAIVAASGALHTLLDGGSK